MTKIQIDIVLLCHETKNIMIMYKSILRPWLFRMDAEKFVSNVLTFFQVIGDNFFYDKNPDRYRTFVSRN